MLRLVAPALLAVAWLPGCGDAPDDAERDQAVPVRLAEVERATLQERVRAIGTLRSTETVELQAEVAGRIEEAPFEEGAVVDAGVPLFTLRDDALQARRRSLRAALRAAQASADRTAEAAERRRPLADTGVVAEEEIATAKAEERQARAEVQRLRAEIAEIDEQLEDTRIVAPFTGRVSRRLVDPGNYVRAGDHLATLYRHEHLEAVLRLPERLTDRVALGQRAYVVPADSPDQAFDAQVTYVSPAVEEAGRDLMIKARPVDTPPDGVTPGMSVRAELTIAERRDRPVVPAEALVAQRRGYVVFVVENDRAHMREVQLGLREPDRVEVVEGVEGGEQVVREGHVRLTDGTRVRVVADAEEEP